MSSTARVLAQAKINLLLRVLAREASGYHSIETVFLRLELADRLTVRIANGRTIDCDARLGDAERNLAFRAASAYTDATGWPAGFAIELEKHIPVGAGLGGGSADAGAVLRALDAMSPNPMGHRLPELAGGLGADVAFMTIDSPMALAWGRGDRLLPLPVLTPRPVLLGVPNFAIGTADAYAWVAATRDGKPPESRAMLLAPEALATWEGMAGIAANDFDDVVSARFPILRGVAELLREHGADIAMLSGSGSTVFGVFTTLPPLARFEVVSDTKWIQTRTADRVVRVEQDR